MEENFEPVARTRANYYTPGSPVQFVCVAVSYTHLDVYKRQEQA